MSRSKTLFDYGGIGQVVITPGALESFEQANEHPTQYLKRHIQLDWGEVDEEDKSANDSALQTGSRLLSAYRLSTGTKIWIITEATVEGQRPLTTILLPDEY